jgi:hypothetical protein
VHEVASVRLMAPAMFVILAAYHMLKSARSGGREVRGGGGRLR